MNSGNYSVADRGLPSAAIVPERGLSIGRNYSDSSGGGVSGGAYRASASMIEWAYKANSREGPLTYAKGDEGRADLGTANPVGRPAP
jgi:hypothetical protein